MLPANNHIPVYTPDAYAVSGVVAVEPAGAHVRVFIRSGLGVTFRDYPFKPFLLLSDPALLDTAPVTTTRYRLDGSGRLCWLARTATWHDWCRLRDYLQQTVSPEQWFGIPDACQQFLVAGGMHFFRDLAWDQVTVLCIAVATAGETEPGSAGENWQQPLAALALSDTDGYEELICADEAMTEHELLQRVVMIIRERDPDVVTGYHLTGSILPGLLKRADVQGLQLHLGRDGSTPHRLQGTDQHRRGKGYGIYGRSLIDTAALVRLYEQQVHPLPGNDLQQVAAWFDCSAGHEQGVPSVLDELRKTAALYRQLAPTWHRQIQQYPASYQSFVIRSPGNTARALLTERYLQQHQALPASVPGTRHAEQRQDELFRRGRSAPVVLCDLSELSAAIIRAYRIGPKGDDAGVFAELLGREKTGQSAVWFELLSQTPYPFSDINAAGEVKRLLRVISADLLAWLRETGAEPVFIDQRSLCFMPPSAQNGAAVVDHLTTRLAEILPGRAVLRFCREYQALFAYSTSNYALLEQNGTLVYRGHGFAYHSMEPFLLEFLKEALALLLAGKAEEVRALQMRYLRKLVSHDFALKWVVRTEALADTLENYQAAVQKGKRNRSAVYELALSRPGVWKIGDRLSYYVAGNGKHAAAHESSRLLDDFDPVHPDINIPWYIERLHQLFKRLEPFLPEEPMLF